MGGVLGLAAVSVLVGEGWRNGGPGVGLAGALLLLVVLLATAHARVGGGWPVPAGLAGAGWVDPAPRAASCSMPWDTAITPPGCTSVDSARSPASFVLRRDGWRWPMLALAAGAAFGCRSGVRSGCVPRVRGLSGFSVCSYLAFELSKPSAGRSAFRLLGAATLIVAGGMRMTHHTPSAPIAALLVDRERG